MLILKILHLPIPSSEAFGNLIQLSHFFSDRDEDLLVADEFVLTEELGIHSANYLHSEEHDSPEEFESQISDRCCAARQLSQNILST